MIATGQPELVEVTRADRETFIYLLGWDYTEKLERIRAGDFDQNLKMQRIARHRLASPAGNEWQVVPRTLTESMAWQLESGQSGNRDHGIAAYWQPTYDAALAAAPTPPS